ncbi:MAG: OmpA family protein [Bacteroidetes bacterium]|nr:OmpA family protein [Bacteroidota bacterium]
MKYLLKTAILVVCVLISLLTQAQKTTQLTASNIFKSHITLQLNGGLTQYFGDLNKDNFFNQNVRNGFGGALGYQFSPLFGLRAQYVKGTLYSVYVKKEVKLNSDFWDASMQLTLNINEIFARYNEKRFVNFYLFGGAGVSSYTSRLNDFSSNYLIRESSSRQSELVVPMGIGAQFRLSKHANLNIEYGDRLTFSDSLLDFYDGGSKRDQYSYASVGLGFRFGGPRDKDKDAIIDKKDKCPDVAGKIELAGCPDADNDGIADNEDDCPKLAGVQEFKGCPDTDGDGIPDTKDKCPKVSGKKELLGCPDKDNDGIADIDDKCPEQAGKAAFQGCPDRDGDEVADKDDECPDVSGLAKFHGCPDKDADSVPDNLDRCPGVPGSVRNFGCPEESNVLVKEVVYFDTDEWIVIDKYNQLLNRIAETMRDNPGIRVTVDGHTDSRESEGYNMQLSENRAEYVIKFFTDRGIDPQRLVKRYYGETRPAASNMTPEGMTLNRRVEIASVK